MSENVWIAIATIIATFIAAFASTMVQVKAMRAIAKPEQNPPKPTTNVKGKVKYFIKTYWADVLGLIFPLVGILTALTLPSNSASVFGIILNSIIFTHNLFYITISLKFLPMLRRRDELLEQMLNVLEQGANVNKEIVTNNSELIATSKALAKIVESTTKPKRQSKLPKAQE